MGWADRHIERLRAGETVQFRPSGHSMEPRVKHRALVTVKPVTSPYDITRNSVVLCKVNGRQYLHLIKAVDEVGQRVLICNARGRENGWIGFNCVYGCMIKVET